MRFHALAFVLLLGLSACSKGCTSERSLKRQESVLNVQLNAEPVSLDPSEVEDGNGLLVTGAVREGLVGYDPQGELEKRLAESYTISSDGQRLEFKLRPDLRWSDGAPLQVEDFVFGIRRGLSPESHGKVSMALLPIRGAQAYRTGKIKVPRDPKDKTLGVFEQDGKLVIELERPAPYFIHALTLPAALPVREDALAESEGKWLEDKQPGTGAYRFAGYQPGKRLLVEANPYYWRGAPKVPMIDFLFLSDETAALNLFETGKMDILTHLPPAEIQRIKTLPTFRSDPFYATYFISFNTRKAPFDDRQFRRAVAGAIARDEIAHALDTGERPARTFLPPGIEGFKGYSEEYDDARVSFQNSVKTVKERLAKTPMPEVHAAFDSSERNSMIMQIIQSNLKKELGMNVALSNMEWKSYVKALQTDAPQIYRMGWLTPFNDPINPLQVFMSTSPSNYTGWGSPKYDELVNKIAAMPSGTERMKKIEEAQKILLEDDAVLVPIYHYVQNHMVSTRVGGFKVNAFGTIFFQNLSFK